MTPLEKIRKACIAANPEIVELKPGCRFQFKGNGVLCESGLMEGKYLAFYGYWPAIGWKYDRYRFKDIKEDIEIKGRPIRLADVLLAMKGYDGRGKYELFIDDEKAYWEHPTWGDRIPVWNLRDDDLEHQSEETIKFLAELLP